VDYRINSNRGFIKPFLIMKKFCQLFWAIELKYISKKLKFIQARRKSKIYKAFLVVVSSSQHYLMLLLFSKNVIVEK